MNGDTDPEPEEVQAALAYTRYANSIEKHSLIQAFLAGIDWRDNQIANSLAPALDTIFPGAKDG